MTFRFLEDIALADVAFEASGESLEELFRESVAALLATMVAEPATVERRRSLRVTLADPELDMLLFAFLQELVFLKDARRLLLHADELAIVETAGGWQMEAVCRGEEIDRGRHPLLVDVKGVTLHRFAVDRVPEGWRGVVTLDV
jgi:SHS2 domain-containing protein